MKAKQLNIGSRNKLNFYVILFSFLFIYYVVFPAPIVLGGDLPEGPVVQVGDPTITVIDKEMTVNAGAADKTWIDWSGGFNIGAENTVNNLANSTSSVILYNDVSGAISNIQGALNGNCNVFLPISTLSMTGGSVTTGAGTLYLGGNVISNANTTSATITGNLNLNGATRTFTIADGDVENDMDISAVIGVTGEFGIIKAGAGTLTLSGANTYSGTTTISEGTLQINNSNALGTGALNLTGTGTVNLNRSSEINSTAFISAGTLNLTNGVDLTGAVDFKADGNVVLSAGSDVTGAITNTQGAANNGNITTKGNSTITGNVGLTGVGRLGSINVTDVVGSGGVTTHITGNVFATDVTVNAGTTFQIDGNADFTNLTLDGGILNSNGSIIINNIDFLDGAINAGGSITINNADNNITDNNITNNVVLTGANAVTLSGDLDFGNISIGAGTPVTVSGIVTLDSNLTCGDITVSTGSTLQIGSILNSVTITCESITIDGGTLQIIDGSNINNTLITTSTVGSIVEFDWSDDRTMENIFSGIGSIEMSGEGTVNLIGANTYTGLTTVSAGKLYLNTQGANAIVGNIAISGGTLKWWLNNQVANTSTLSITSGAVDLNGKTETLTAFTNSGGIFTTGAGHLIVTGNTVTWSGGTNTINHDGIVEDNHIVITGGMNTVEGQLDGTTGGVLQLNAGGSGLEMTGATLTLNSDAGVAGKLLLKGDVTTYASATASNISNSGTSAQLGNVDLNGGTRTFTVADGAAASDLSISAQISNGGLIKAGFGTLTLSSANTYSGATTITAGTLQINNANALGTGAVINNATLDIGSNTLNVIGIYTQNTAASTLNVTVDSPSISGKISSASAAVVTTTSKIYVTVADSVYIPNNATFTVIDTVGAGVNVPGTITSSSSRVTFSGQSSSGDLILTANRSGSGFSSLSADSNGSAAGAVLDNILNPSSDMTIVLNTLEGLSNTQTGSALDTMVPTVDMGVLNNSTASLNNFVGASLNRVQSVLTLAASGNSNSTGISSGDESKLSGIWAKNFGSYLSQGTRKGIQGYDAWNAGIAIGMDRLFSDTLTLGISGGYAYGNVDSDANNGNTNIDSAQGTIYAGYQDANTSYFIDAAGSFAWNWYKGKRDINVGTISRTANADYNGQQYGAYLGGGYKLNLGNNLELTPLASIQWNHLRLAGYTETNAGSMNLSVNRQSYDILQSGLGARVTSQVKCKWGNFTPEVHAKWLYDFIGDDMAVTSTYTGGGGSFTSNGANPAKSSISLGGKLSFDFKNDVSLIAECDTEIKDEFFGVYGSATLRYKF